jgi:hypothetical protein
MSPPDLATLRVRMALSTVAPTPNLRLSGAARDALW